MLLYHFLSTIRRGASWCAQHLTLTVTLMVIAAASIFALVSIWNWQASMQNPTRDLGLERGNQCVVRITSKDVWAVGEEVQITIEVAGDPATYRHRWQARQFRFIEGHETSWNYFTGDTATIGTFDAEQKFWIEVRVNVANFNCEHPAVIRNDTQKITIKAPSAKAPSARTRDLSTG